MFRKMIPEEELASLREAVRNVIQNPAIFEYRQYELDQAPSPEIVKQAQDVWDLVCELKVELDNMDPKQAKQKIGQLELLLIRINEKDYSHLHWVMQKAKDIAELAKDLILQDPDLIAIARKDEVHDILASATIQLEKHELDDILDEADKRERIKSPEEKSCFRNIFSRKSATVMPLSPFESLSSAFDAALDESYKRFSKTQMGEYVKKYQLLVEKFSQKRKWREKEIVKLRAELQELRKKLLPEDQKKLDTLQLREKTKLELLVGLLPEEDYNRFLNHLKRNTKLNAKNLTATKE